MVDFSRAIGPLQLAIHVVHNHRAGEQKPLWDKTHKGNYHKKLRMGFVGLVLNRLFSTRDDSQRRFFAQHSVTMLEQCCNHSKQCRSNVAKLSCAKNRRCESSRVTTPLSSHENSSARASRFWYISLMSTGWPRREGDLTRDDSQRWFITQHRVPMLQRCVALKSTLRIVPCNITWMRRFMEALVCYSAGRSWDPFIAGVKNISLIPDLSHIPS